MEFSIFRVAISITRVIELSIKAKGEREREILVLNKNDSKSLKGESLAFYIYSTLSEQN